jgi:hypothetical protein
MASRFLDNPPLVVRGFGRRGENPAGDPPLLFVTQAILQSLTITPPVSSIVFSGSP